MNHDVKKINRTKYHEESKTRTPQMQCIAWQLEIPEKLNITTEVKENHQLNPGEPSNMPLVTCIDRGVTLILSEITNRHE